MGPARLLPAGAATCDADIWRAFVGQGQLIVPSDGPHADWIRSVILARGWDLELVADPRERVAQAHPELIPYLEELISTGDANPPQSVWLWAEQLLDDLPPSSTPSTAHAELVGIWRLGRELSGGLLALLRAGVRELALTGDSDAYEFAASASSESLLSRIVGEVAPSYSQEFDVTKESLLVSKIDLWTRSHLAKEGFDAIKTALMSNASFAAKATIAGAVVSVATGVSVPKSALSILKPYLSSADHAQLQVLIQPDSPDEVPKSLSQLGGWYEESYLPYRSWMHAKGIVSDEVAEEIWSQFADIYLSCFAKAVGSGHGELALHRSRHIRGQATGSLVVILDGPLPWDVTELVARMKTLAGDWSVVESSWVLAAIPTVTEVCRPSVVCGVVVTSVVQDDAVTSFTKAKSELAAGKPFVAVKLEQPDKAYHSIGESPEKLRLIAKHQVNLIADELAALLSHHELESVFITADHGRCMGKVNPIVPVEVGVVQGRAALEVDRSAIVESTLARRLNGELYGFSKDMDAVVALGANGFSGSKFPWYPHGGLLPEEAFVPWIELRKVSAKAEIEGELSVVGVLRMKGELTGEIRNISRVTLRLLRIEWMHGGEIQASEFSDVVILPVNPYQVHIVLPAIVEHYPDSADVIVATPDGMTYSIKTPLANKVRRMQTQSIDLLDDL